MPAVAPRQESRPRLAAKACPLRARPDGKPQRFTATHDNETHHLTCIYAAQRIGIRSLPSWSCGFDSRHPLSSVLGPRVSQDLAETIRHGRSGSPAMARAARRAPRDQSRLPSPTPFGEPGLRQRLSALTTAGMSASFARSRATSPSTSTTHKYAILTSMSTSAGTSTVDGRRTENELAH